MTTHSSSAIIRANLSEQDETFALEPLLSSPQSPDRRWVREDRSFPSMFVARVKSCRCPMAVRSPRTCAFASLKWIPVFFIFAVIGWSYYAYVVQMCIYTIDSVPKKVIYLLIYHLVFVLFLWSYLRTIFGSSLVPPREFYVNETDGEHISSAQTVDERRAMLLRLARQSTLPLLTRHFDGSIRYCFVCQCIKPDRAHHCSICERCVLRYDHHCPWTNSCISYGNYKFFVLFLGYATLFCLYVSGSSMEYFIRFWQGIDKEKSPESGQFHLLFLVFVSVMFGISVASLFFYHLFLTGKNRTTVESFRSPIFATGPERHGFDLGWTRNFQEIFGTDLCRTWIPIFSTRGDGVHYQMSNTLLTGFHRSTDTLIPVER